MACLSAEAALPAELLSIILEYLPINELWTAARASRQFYAAAWRAGLFIHRDIEWLDDNGHADELAVFKDVLEQARRKDVLRLSLTLACYPSREHYPRRHAVSSSESDANEIFSVVSAALPFLVYLTINIPDEFRPQLHEALGHPAPRLRTLNMYRNSYHVPCLLPLPCDLFAGSAPLLHTLTLHTVTLPNSAVTAFRAVSQAALTYYNHFPRIRFRDQLPNLKDLDLQFTVSFNGHAALPHYSDLAGLPLRSLAIEDNSSDTMLLDAITHSLSAIPVVFVGGKTIKWDERLWAADKAALSIRLTHLPDGPWDEATLLVNVSPAHRRWRRLYRLNEWDTGMPVPLRGLPNLPARLTYLRADAMAVCGLLKLELSLSALRNLHIDLRGYDSEPAMLQSPDYNATLDVLSSSSPRVWTPCQALEQITLFALHRPLTVDSRRVACLAHAFGQLGRRVPLSLAGVEFDEPVADALLEQTVRTIVMHAFGDSGWRACNDEGLWDFELFNRDL